MRAFFFNARNVLVGATCAHNRKEVNRVLINKRKPGFSLLELVVSVVVIGILSSIGLVTYKAVIDRASDKASLASVTRIGNAAAASYAGGLGSDSWATAITEVTNGASLQAAGEIIPGSPAVAASAYWSCMNSWGRNDFICFSSLGNRINTASIAAVPATDRRWELTDYIVSYETVEDQPAVEGKAREGYMQSYGGETFYYPAATRN